MYRQILRVPTAISPTVRQTFVSTYTRPLFVSAVRVQSTDPRRPTQRGVTMAATTRVSDRIKHDHQELQELYNNIKNSKSHDDRERWQNQFVWELARHSVAEEIVVYPAFEAHVDGGFKMAEKDRSAHQAVGTPPPTGMPILVSYPTPPTHH